MPSRRQALVGAGLLGGGLLGGRLSTGTARAQAAGAQGTEDSPNDMFAWNLDVQNGVTSDLPMGGNDVTGVGALDVEQASIGDRWNPIADDQDADGSTPLNLTVDNLPQFDFYKIIISIDDDSDSTALRCRINQHNTDGDYRFTAISDSVENFGVTDNKDSFELLEGVGLRETGGVWIINDRGGNAGIHGSGASRNEDSRSLFQGHCNEVLDVTRIDIFTETDNASGTLVVEGRDRT